MITIEQIISNNLAMLKEQEASLLKSLSFIQKARQLFEAQNSSAPTTRTRRKRRGRKARAVTVKVAQRVPAKKKQAKGKKQKGTHMERIVAVLKQKNTPLTSGELIQVLFKQQSADKNLAHFRQGIYTTLTQAYKKKVVIKKEDKIHLPS